MATTIILATIVTIAEKYRVTVEQMDKATHCTMGRKCFYIVESQSEAGVEYRVEWNEHFNVLTCNCKAGQQGIPCWHKRAALAAEEYFKAQQQARRRTEQAEVEATPQYQAEQLQQAMHELEAMQAELEASQRATA